MSYTSEIFNRYKEITDKSGLEVIKAIMYLLKPEGGYSKFQDEIVVQRYTLWQADARALDAACGKTWYAGMQGPLVMPPDDEEHKPCRMMAAVLIERNIYSDFVARHSLVQAVKVIREIWPHAQSIRRVAHVAQGNLLLATTICFS